MWRFPEELVKIGFSQSQEEPPHPSLAYFTQSDGDAFVLSTQNTMD